MNLSSVFFLLQDDDKLAEVLRLVQNLVEGHKEGTISIVLAAGVGSVLVSAITALWFLLKAQQKRADTAVDKALSMKDDTIKLLKEDLSKVTAGMVEWCDAVNNLTKGIQAQKDAVYSMRDAVLEKLGKNATSLATLETKVEELLAKERN